MTRTSFVNLLSMLLVVLIIIGVGAFYTKSIWVPRVVLWIGGPKSSLTQSPVSYPVATIDVSALLNESPLPIFQGTYSHVSGIVILVIKDTSSPLPQYVSSTTTPGTVFEDTSVGGHVSLFSQTSSLGGSYKDSVKNPLSDGEYTVGIYGITTPSVNSISMTKLLSMASFRVINNRVSD